MTDLLAERPLPGSSVAALLLLFALLGLPHLWHLSPLLMSLFYLTLAWRALALRWPRWLPGRWLRGLLTLGALATVAVSVAGQLDGRALGVGLLTVMAGMKSLECRGHRDLFVMVFLGCFLLATQFLFDQGLWLNLYLAPLLLGLLGVLAHNNRVQPPGWRRALLDAGRLVVAGVPMTLLLFVLFPRLPGPLWGLSTPSAGVTGMTDRLEPGSVSQLSQSQALAFRVSFAGERPANSQLYWRGPVFWDTDGRSWSAVEPAAPVVAKAAQNVGWVQDITLEPSNQLWLFALDRPVAAPPASGLSRDGQLFSVTPVRERRHYRVVSRPGDGGEVLDDATRGRALALPRNVTSPRMQQLVDRWRAADPSPAAMVEAALRHFREQPFVYTLTPPPLPGNVVDGFLFDTRRGFCEHYATSFTVLMRLAGIPARVIGGYQGGEWNPRGEHLVVRQSDAHAWAEVWLDDHWQRVDPTAAVAPERIERPIDIASAAQGGAVTFQAPAPGWLATLWREGGWMLDGLELGWQRWVVGYTDRTQAGLLAGLGLDWLRGYWLGLATVLAAGLAMLPLWWLLRQQWPERGDAALRAYRLLQMRLRRAGMQFPDSLSPSELARRAGARFPGERVELASLVSAYLHARYGPSLQMPRQRRELRRLARRIRQLRLQQP